MRRLVMPRLVATTVAFASVLGLGFAVSHGRPDDAVRHAAGAYSTARDRGWCC
jgi:hypothetical protein